MPTVPTAQVHSTPSLYLLQLALYESAKTEAGEAQGGQLQLQPRLVLFCL